MTVNCYEPDSSYEEDYLYEDCNYFQTTTEQDIRSTSDATGGDQHDSREGVTSDPAVDDDVTREEEESNEHANGSAEMQQESSGNEGPNMGLSKTLRYMHCICLNGRFSLIVCFAVGGVVAGIVAAAVVVGVIVYAMKKRNS